MKFLLIPPVAFLLYLVLVGVLAGVGQRIAAPGAPAAHKADTYNSGSPAPRHAASPGYQMFFITALFFAVLHLGVLMIGSSQLLPASGLYLIGLIVALLALILG